MNLEDNIITANLILEPILPKHSEILFDSLQSDELYTYIPQNPPKSVNSLKDKYTKWSKRQSSDNEEIWINYAIYHKLKNIYVGTVQATIQSNDTYIAYEVFPNYWKNGIAKEACNALIHFLFSNYSSKIIKAHVDTRNKASIGLLNSLGFKCIDKLLGADEFKGSISDEFVYSIERK